LLQASKRKNYLTTNKSRNNVTWKKTDVRAMQYPYRSKEKSPRAAIRTPAAVQITERVTYNNFESIRTWQKIAKSCSFPGEN